MSKDEIRKRIIESNHKKERDPHNNFDRLEFLTNSQETETTYFELKEPIRLKNSWGKKGGKHLVMGMIACMLIYSMMRYSDLHEWWHWITLLILAIATILYLIQFFENKIILEISSQGLTLEEYVFNKWDDIEFLYFKTEYNGEGYSNGIYLIELLKSGIEHKILISNLTWSTDRLGSTLYQCMKKYAKQDMICSDEVSR